MPAQRSRPVLQWLGFVVLAVLSLLPLCLASAPSEISTSMTWTPKVCVVSAMLLAIGVRAFADRNIEAHSNSLAVLLIGIAAAMTAWHWIAVDSSPARAAWQQRLYLKILSHSADAPHQYRPLPYGFTRTLEWLTGDWRFACLAYRWFFSYWFLWAAYRFARLFHSPTRALLTLLPPVVLYPLAIAHYWGQLTDPLSHALFVLGLIYVVEDRPVALAVAVALGVLAKETAVLIVPAYLACYARFGWVAWRRAALIGAAGAAMFLAARLPLGWRPGYHDINGTEQLMIASNLGLPGDTYQSTVPLWLNYVHPLLFVGSFLPFIALTWRQTDHRLQAIFTVLVPLLLISNLCFGWLYESRNYLPLVPLLGAMAMPFASGRSDKLDL
jgi:hypothetical protein